MPSVRAVSMPACIHLETRRRWAAAGVHEDQRTELLRMAQAKRIATMPPIE